MRARFERHTEERITSHAEAHEPLVRLLRHITVHHHGVARRIEVDDGRLRLCLWEERLEETGHIFGEGWWLLAWVDSVRPVILAAESDPMQTPLHDLLHGEGLVN